MIDDIFVIRSLICNLQNRGRFEINSRDPVKDVIYELHILWVISTVFITLYHVSKLRKWKGPIFSIWKFSQILHILHLKLKKCFSEKFIGIAKISRKNLPAILGIAKIVDQGGCPCTLHSFMDEGLSEERASCNSLELMKWIQIFHGRIFRVEIFKGKFSRERSVGWKYIQWEFSRVLGGGYSKNPSK